MSQITARKPDEIKKRILEDASFDGVIVEKVHKGALVGWLNKYLGGDENRRAVLAWLFNKQSPMSANDLTDKQMFALHCWVSASKNEDGDWEPQPCFAAEAALVLTETIKWVGTLGKMHTKLFGEAVLSSGLFDVVNYQNGVVTALTDENENAVYNKNVMFPPDVFPSPRVEEKPVEEMPKPKKTFNRKNIF